MSRNISFLAGPKALQSIRDHGLKQEMITVMAGASGGPKWLVLSSLDRVLCTYFFKGRKKPLYLIGSSAGAWRFAGMSTKNQVKAINSFEQTYSNFVYKGKPTPENVTRQSIQILENYINDESILEILNHPYMRLCFFADKAGFMMSTDNRFILGPGLASAAVLNLISRKSLRFFFKRTLFYDPRNIPPFFNMDEFPIERIHLTKDNFKPALLASGSVPFAMSGVTNIPGNPGTYRDGGVIDYHLDIPFTDDSDGIVLYPHYTDRIIPGWFDKKIPWRKPHKRNIENVLIVCPSQEFVDRLPLKRIPQRSDFKQFAGRDDERISNWSRTLEENKRIADEFMEAVQSGKLKEMVRPIS